MLFTQVPRWSERAFETVHRVATPRRRRRVTMKCPFAANCVQLMLNENMWEIRWVRRLFSPRFQPFASSICIYMFQSYL